MKRQRQPGRAWATFGFVAGISASIAANVADSYVPPAGAAGSWSPPVGAIVAAGVWPAIVIIAIEVIARVRWPRRWYYVLARYGGLVAVALFAAVISYGHLSNLLTSYGEDPLVTVIGPLAIDGLMVVCSAALLAIGEQVRQRDASPAQPPAPAPAPARPKRDASARPKRDASATTRAAAARKVADARHAWPASTQEEVAKVTRLSLRTVQRHWLTPHPAAASTDHAPTGQDPRNGADVQPALLGNP